MKTTGDSGETMKRLVRRMGVAVLLPIMLAAMILADVSPTFAQGASRQPGPPTGGAASAAAHAPTSQSTPMRHASTLTATKGQPGAKPKPAVNKRLAAGQILWSFGTPGWVLDSPTVVNGIVYIDAEPTGDPSSTAGVFALDAGNGALLWSYHPVSVNSFSAPKVNDGVVYVSSSDSTETSNFVNALDAVTGAPLWSYQTTYPAISPTVVNGVVYVGSIEPSSDTAGDMYALNAGTGALLWKYHITSGIEYSPSVFNSTVYFGADSGYVYALNAATGTLKWRYLTSGAPYAGAEVEVVNGIVYAGSSGGYVYALSASSGALLWKYQTGGKRIPTVVNGVAYAGSIGTTYALNATTGALIWSANYGTQNEVSPTVANGEVFVNSIYALSATTGARLWVKLAQQPPAVANGVAYGDSLDSGGYSTYFALDAATGAELWSLQTGGGYTDQPVVVNGVEYAGGINTCHCGLALYAFVGSPPIQDQAQGPTGFERFGGGNPSELRCGCFYGDPIDSYSGNFSHTFDDLSIPGRGIPLDFSQTYNAGAAAQNGPLGYGWTNSYNWSLSTDGSGNVTITQENGSAVSFAPNGSGGYTPPSRVLATLVKNGDGSYTFTRQQSQDRYVFNSSGKLIKEMDRNGYVTSLAYNGSGQMTTVTDPAGRKLTFSYDSGGRITKVTDPGSRQVSFSYDGSGNLHAFTDVAGGVTSFTYTSSHRLLTMTDPRGGVVTNVYDSNGRVTSQQDALGRTTTFSYTGPDGNGNSSTTITDPRGNVTVDQYYNGLLLAETKGYGTAQATTTSYTYDPLSLGVASITDPNGNITSQAWDANGNLLSTTDPLGRTTTNSYDAQNDLLSTTDANGVTTTNSYDAHGNLLATSTPLTGTSQTRTVTYAYGSASHPGDLTGMTDPNGQKWHYGYDADGDRTTTTDPLGDVTTDAYNALGERTSETNALGETTTTSYDAFGDVTAVTDPLNHTTAYQYDAKRNQTQVTDPDGHVTQNAYDLDNELTQVTRSDGSTLSYSYDNDGNQTTQTDGLGHTTTYAYDPLNHLSALSDPLGRATTYTYDTMGNRTSQTFSDDQAIYYVYDSVNELTGVYYSDGTPNVTYSYDSDGRRVSMSDGMGTTTYSYDSSGRLASATDGAGNTVGYGYDLAGNLTSLTYPGGNKVTRGYDVAGRMTSVGDWLGHTTRFSYDKAGELTGITYPDHVVGVLAYNLAGQLVTENYSYAACASPCGVAWRPLVGFSYTRDAAGFVASATTTGIAQPQQTYSYTGLNQLASATSGGGSATSYVYDKADEPTQLGATTLTEDAAGEVTQLVAGATTTSFTDDARGNRTQMAVSGGATVSYTYDVANRLTSVSGIAAGTTTYIYNGDGLRMSKTVGTAAAEDYVWDTAERLPLLLVDGMTSFVAGPGGLPLEQITGSGSGAKALYLLTDQLSSVRALADSSGKIVATYTYDAYGATTATVGTVSTPLRFAGQYRDAETGLYYLRARYYDPATAQFLTRDPLVPLTKQPYLYVGDNPLNARDPSGMFPWSAIAEITRAVADKVAGAAGIVAAGCGIGALITSETIIGGLTFGGCAVIAGGVSVIATTTKAEIDWITGSGDGGQDSIDLLLSAGGLMGGVTGAEEVATTWQKWILHGWDVIDSARTINEWTSPGDSRFRRGGCGGGGGW